MTDSIPELKAEIVRLNKIVDALMNRIESASSLQGSDFNLFETAVTLEEQVKERTAEIESALKENERIRAELAASEAKYRALVNQSFVGITIIEDGKFTFTNHRFEEILGYTADELSRLSPAEITIPEDRPLVAEQMRKRLTGEAHSVHYQSRITRKDGSLRYLEIDGTMAEINGKVVPISAIKDITDQVMKERELQASESQFRAIFENSLGGIVITRMTDGRINEINDAFLSVSGYSRDELLGQSTLKLGLWRNPEQRTSILQRVQHGQSIYAEPASLRTKSGEEKEMLISARMINLLDTPSLIVSTTDVTELNQSKIEIDNQRLRLQALIEAQPVGIALFDAERRLVLWNARYQELLNYPEELLSKEGQRFDDLIRYNHARGDYPGMTEAEALTRFVGHVSTHTPLHMVRKGYGNRTLEIDGVPLASGDTLLSYTDISEIASAEEQMRTLANHDPLTRLPNRRLFTDRIVLTLAANKRSHKYAAVMMLDLDHFKPLNDQHGHQAGDLLLIEVGARLKRSVRDEDTVARVGGDEFVVMLVNLNTDPEKAAIEARFVADKILTTIATPYFIEVPGDAATKVIEHQCSCSIGIALFSEGKEEVEQIVKNADSAMYQAKADGRNRACLFGEIATPSTKPAS